MADIASHYSGPGLAKEILRLAGKGAPAAAELAPFDEFHIGGRRATLDFAGRLGLAPGMRVLDIGCGVGGAARAIAEQAGIHVTGLDLSADYIEAAKELSKASGLAGATEFYQGDAAGLPFADGVFDAAYSIHVSMNVADKHRLYAEARRVLKPSAPFGLYDVMAGSVQDMAWPVPWASGPEMSFLITLDALEDILASSRFVIEQKIDCTGFALSALERPPGPGIRLLMGDTADAKIANLRDNFRAGCCSLWQIAARAV